MLSLQNLGCSSHFVYVSVGPAALFCVQWLCMAYGDYVGLRGSRARMKIKVLLSGDTKDC